MAAHATPKPFRPMNVVVAQGSRAEAHFRERAALPTPPDSELLAPGLPPVPRHNLRFHGGHTIEDLSYVDFYLGGRSSWHAADIDRIERALAAAMTDRRLDNVLMQYFRNRPLGAVAKPPQTLAGAHPGAFSQGDAHLLVKQLHAQGKLAGFDLSSTIVNLMLPRGTVLHTGSEPTHAELRGLAHDHVDPERDDSSMHGLGGYHGSVHPSAGITVYYAVGVFSERLADGRENGVVAFDEPWKNVVATFYHALCEARTNPDVEDAIRAGDDPQAVKFLGWVSSRGEECGDHPLHESGHRLGLVMQEIELADGSGVVPVQFQYSNAAKGFEGPIEQPHARLR